MRRLGRALRKLLSGLLVAAAILVGLDLLATAWEYHQNGTVRILGRPVGVYAGGDPDGGAPSLNPGAHLAGAAHDVRLNQLGFRGPEIAPGKPAGTLRVWCLGGSTTFDIGASDNDHTWPARAEARLRERLPGRRIEVVNAGIPGEVLAGNLADLERLGPTVRPDVVVVYHGPNDLGRVMDAKVGPPPPPNALLTDLALYRALTDLLPAPVGPPGWHANVPTDAELAAIDDEVRRILAVTRRLGATGVLTSHALNARPDARGWTARRQVGAEARMKRLLPDDYVEVLGRINEHFRALAAAEGLPFLDVRAAVPPGDDHFDDGIHFRDAGSALAGVAVADGLVAAGVLGEAR